MEMRLRQVDLVQVCVRVVCISFHIPWLQLSHQDILTKRATGEYALAWEKQENMYLISS